MPPRTRHASDSRTEARRRARLTAAGRETEERDDEPARPAPPQPGIFQRIFPMPPPLAGYPDPLAGFAYHGPFAGVARTLYTLGRRPTVWIAFGLAWAICYVGTTLLGSSFIGVAASLGTFGSLVAAGWFGWPRPWAYGAASAALGYLIFGLVLALIATRGYQLTVEPISPLQAAISLAFSGIFMTIIGALAGFYGGYLRRRMGQPRSAASSRRR